MVVRRHNVDAGSANTKGSHVLQSRPRRVYRLEDLVKRMTPRNVHKELDFGGPMGRETL